MLSILPVRTSVHPPLVRTSEIKQAVCAPDPLSGTPRPVKLSKKVLALLQLIEFRCRDKYHCCRECNRGLGETLAQNLGRAKPLARMRSGAGRPSSLRRDWYGLIIAPAVPQGSFSRLAAWKF